MSQYLKRRIAAIRAKHVTVSAGTGLAMAAACCVTITVVAAVADYYLNLSLSWRRALLVFNGLVVAYCVVRYSLVPLFRRLDDETLALAVERVAPAFRSRLIAAIQFSRPGALTAGESGGIVQAMVTQTEQLARNVNFLQVVRADRFVRWAGLAIAALVATSSMYALAGDISSILLRRAMLEEVALPQKTHVEVLSGNFRVAIGERAQLLAKAKGYQPDEGVVTITYASGRTLSAPLKHDVDQPEAYSLSIESVPEPFTYQIRLFDGVSPTYKVSADERPVVQSLTCIQLFPPYTGMDDMRRQPTDLLLLAGSKLRLSIFTNKPLAKNAAEKPLVNLVRLHNQKETPEIPAVALQPDPADPKHFTAEIPLPENIAGFSIRLTDENGLESRNPPFYPVDLLSDHAPSVRITAPERREILVTAEASTSVGFVAEDDFGLASLNLHYRVDEQPETTIPLAIRAGDRQVKGYYPWQVSKLPTPPEKASLEGCVVEFWVEARDANNVTTPGITASEHYQLRIVSKSDKQAELIARMAESFSTIHDVSNNQENAAAELGSLITEQPSENSQPKP